MPQEQIAIRSGLLPLGKDHIKNRQRLSSLYEGRTEEGVAKELKPIMSELNKEVIDLVWGKPSGGEGVSTSIFRRWSQGFVFSEHEQTALKQFEGGPCAVIAPVQARLSC